MQMDGINVKVKENKKNKVKVKVKVKGVMLKSFPHVENPRIVENCVENSSSDVENLNL